MSINFLRDRKSLSYMALRFEPVGFTCTSGITLSDVNIAQGNAFFNMVSCIIITVLSCKKRRNPFLFSGIIDREKW